MSDGLIFLLDQVGMSLAHAQRVIAEQQQAIAERDARIAELQATAADGETQERTAR